MSADRLPATRATLLQTRRQLAQVGRGTVLLHRKREALVRELFRLARKATDVREEIGARMVTATPILLEALATHGAAGLRTLSVPARDITVEIEPARVWGIPASNVRDVPAIRRRPDARGVAPSSAGPAAAEAAFHFEMLLELLLAAAPAEQRLRRLGSAVSQTGRRLRTLEERISPSLRARQARVRRALDEREREERHRLQWLKSRAER